MTEVELRYALDPSLDEGFSAARARFGTWLDQQGIDGDDAEELHVVLSELVANAVEATVDGSPVSVWAQRHGSTVWVEVTNSAERSVRFPPMPDPPADPLGPSGRGLLIVGAFTDRVAAETLDGRTRVTAVKTLRPGERPA
jgi:anti-sigma regulatory factor (Ser/Thr protein kinase)